MENSELPAHDIYMDDTLEGYRQLFALVDWLRAKQPVLIGMRMVAQQYSNISSSHDELCNLVKWCFEQLAKEVEGE